jgi:hypothetical protein
VSRPNKNSNIGPPRIALGSFGLPEKPMAILLRHVKNEVVGLKDNNRVVLLKNGAQVDNDALIIASGGHFIKKLPSCLRRVLTAVKPAKPAPIIVIFFIF